MVGQHQADLNRGPDASSFFTLNPVTMVDLQEPMATLDPDTHPSASPEYDTAKASGCMSRDVTEMIIGDWLGTYTVAEETLYHPNPLVDGSGRTIMSPAEWVWRHTQHSDINGDGFADRIFNVPFLEEDSIYAGLYRINTFDCGHFTQIYLGDGRGGFIATGHGLDDTSTNPIDTEHKEQVKVASGPHTTVTYTTLRNGFSAVDLNRNGRPEVTLYPQATGVGTTHPIVLHNQGLTPSTAGFGCGLTVGTGCPDSGDATLPIRSLGLAPISHQYRTLTDINGDGAVDAFELYWDNSTKAYSVSYFPSEHQQPQNRLVAIQGPQGGETSVVWTTSAQTPDNTIPLNVDVIASRTQHGTTLYSYHNAYRNAEGKFAGFGRVVTKPPTGAVSIETFHIYDAFGGKPIDRQLYDADGHLRSYTSYLHGKFTPGGGYSVDPLEPFFNPTIRECTTHFTDGYRPPNLDELRAHCQNFTDEAGADDGGGEDPQAQDGTSPGRAVWAILEGKTITDLTLTDAYILNQLAGLQQMLIGGPAPVSSSFIFDSSWSGPAYGPVFDPPATVDGQPPILSVHVPDFIDSSADELSFARPGGQVVTPHQSRTYVTQWDYDISHGNVLEKRELKDIELLEDSLIHTFTYDTYDHTFQGAHLITKRVADRIGEHSTEHSYAFYVGD
ncbi:MAG: hypothetical protein AAFS10_21580, partial [Myxococcota bacterium]